MEITQVSLYNMSELVCVRIVLIKSGAAAYWNHVLCWLVPRQPRRAAEHTPVPGQWEAKHILMIF